MTISNKVTFATDPKTDPVSGQPNKNASIDARLRQFGWDYNEKPLRQDLNLVLNEIGQNIEDLDQQHDDFVSRDDTKPLQGFVPQGVIGVDSGNTKRINMSAGTDLTTGIATLQEQSSKALQYRLFGGGDILAGDTLFADSPVGNVYGVIPSPTPTTLVEGVYCVTALYRLSDNTTNYVLTDIVNPYDIPGFISTLGYTYSAPLFPVVWDGSDFIKSYVSNDRIIYYDAPGVTLLSSITTAANTMYELDLKLGTSQRLIPNSGYNGLTVINREQTTRAKVSLIVTGADVSDSIMGATGATADASIPAFASLGELHRIGPVISPDTFVYINDEFESNYSKLYYYSTQAGNTVTISGVVRSYINPFSKYNILR